MFGSVLVANRGEIAVRVIRTLNALGIRSVAVYSDADADAPHVSSPTRRSGSAAARRASSYLSIERVVAAAVEAGADAIHPGLRVPVRERRIRPGVCRAGIVFIGPPPEAIELLGDKVRAKLAAEEAGVPVLQGCSGRG